MFKLPFQYCLSFQRSTRTRIISSKLDFEIPPKFACQNNVTLYSFCFIDKQLIEIIRSAPVQNSTQFYTKTTSLFVYAKWKLCRKSGSNISLQPHFALICTETDNSTRYMNFNFLSFYLRLAAFKMKTASQWSFINI